MTSQSYSFPEARPEMYRLTFKARKPFDSEANATAFDARDSA
jgi:hypothetical protein